MEVDPATPGLGRRSASPPSPAEGGRSLLAPDEFHPVSQAERLTDLHVCGATIYIKYNVLVLGVFKIDFSIF